MRRSALLIVFAMLTIGSVTIAGSEADAHPSDCHAQQTCPSDDHSYVWFDSAGNGWDCALTTAGGAAGEGTIITWEGASYACLAAPGTTTSPGETVTTPTTPPETAPPPPPRPPRPPPPPPERPRASSIQSPSSASSQAPIRTFLGVVSAKLTKGGYVFPVYGPSSFSDTYGAPRATTSWHHGIDIFAPLGAPILAVADGTVFSVGWNDVGGNRLWLRDRYNNHFYYAHLSGFTPLAVDGARVKAGTVLGFVGNTGDAVGTPPHLHFEIHPAARLHLGYDGSINPYQYLLAWQRLQDVRLSPDDARFAAAAGWASPFGSASAPRPGAVLLQLSDISTASGLDRGSLQRAFAAPVTLDRTVGPLWKSAGDESDAYARERGGSADVFWNDVAKTLAWDVLAQCESGGDWGANTGNGYFGGLQFHPGTWVRYGGLDFAPYADQATRLEQITIAERVLAVEGWEAWPACSKKIGLR